MTNNHDMTRSPNLDQTGWNDLHLVGFRLQMITFVVTLAPKVTTPTLRQGVGGCFNQQQFRCITTGYEEKHRFARQGWKIYDSNYRASVLA